MRTSRFLIYSVIPIQLILLVSSCGILEPQRLAGSLVIILEKKDMDTNSELAKVLDDLNSVQCILKKGAETLYDNNLTKIDNYYKGEFNHLEPGNDYSILLYGKNVSSEIIQRGSQSGISIKAGEETTVTITWSDFVATLSSPSNGSTTNDVTPTFDWSDVSGASVYELELDNSSSFDSPEIDQNSLSSSEYTAVDSLSEDLYYWRVRCRDSLDNWGGWSEVWSFTVDTDGPSPPILSSPSNGSIITDNTISFDWSDVSSTSYYELEVDSASSFLTPIIDDSSLTSSYYLSYFLLSYGMYYWRVRAKNSLGQWGAWSETWNFTIQTVTSEYGDIVVSGSGYAYLNGTYIFFRLYNGKPSWWKGEYWGTLPDHYIHWRTDIGWVIDHNRAALSDAYVNLQDTPLPPQTGWIAGDDSRYNLAPAPTLSGEGTQDTGFETDTITDIDGNVYQTVKIGNQWWMAENLKVTHFCNGDAIPNVTGDTEWCDQSTGAYCAYDNNETNANTYGYLYNWYAVNDSRNIAPEGWHVPTDEEWKELEMYLGMSQSEADDSYWRGSNQGSKLAGNAALWIDGDLENNAAFEESGFSALPGGSRGGEDGDFSNLGAIALFWSSTTESGSSSNIAWYRGLYYHSSGVRREFVEKKYGLTVRCVKGEPVTLDSIAISPSTVTLYNNETQQFTCTAYYSDASTMYVTSSATWSTSPGTAGSIDSNGLFTASSSTAGTETVTASYGGKENTASVTVLATVTLSSIEISPSSVGLSNGSTQQFTCTATYSDETTQDVTSSATWSTSPGTAGSIDSNGLFTASSSTTGTETVTASLDGEEATASVNVYETGTVTDIDGNVYQTVKIGDQWWMAENLKVTHFRNGDQINHVYGTTAWDDETASAFCNYDNNAENSDTYGRLYNFYAVDDSRCIAPDGWHIPTDEEWQTLLDYLGGRSVAGGKMKEVGTAHWSSPNTGATNESGFSALPGGSRTSNGVYENLLSDAGFWSSNQSENNALYLHLDSDGSDASLFWDHIQNGFSVRCIKDTDSPATLNSIEIEPLTATLSKGEIQHFTCTAYYSDGSNQDVSSSATWSTTPGTAGSINTRGLFIASSSVTGTETITANYGGQEATASVYVVETGFVTDIDGNAYQTVKIGDQWWMVENLKVTHYRNGDAIPNVTDKTEWSNLTTGAYCAYVNAERMADTYGYLYNWYVVNDGRNIAPEGWHVPSDEEWQTLVDYLGGSSVAGGKLKESGTDHWQSPNTGATNESGFSAFSGGCRNSNDGHFGGLGNYAYFWSSTGYNSNNAWNRVMTYLYSVVYHYYSGKSYGFAIRLVRD